MTWDMTIFTDKRLKHDRPDITVVKKYTQEWILIEQCWASGPKYPCNWEGKIATFSFSPSHETSRAPQRNPQSSLTPKNT